jgi:hypothetical protein
LFSTSASLAVAIGLSALAVMGPAVAQDAPKAESTATPSATVEGTSDPGRHHRHKHDDTAKAADGAGKAEPAAEADAGAKPPAVSTIDSSAVAVVKPPEQECRSVKTTGSRVPKTICATHEQWKEVDARGAEGARQTKQTLSDSAAIARPSPPLPGGGLGP